MGEAGNGHAAIAEALRQVMRGGLALDGGAGRQHDLGNAGRPGARDERGDAEFLGPDAVKGGEHAAQHMVAAAKGARALQRPEIGHILDDAERGGVPRRIGAYAARIGRVEIAAFGTGRNRLRRRFQHAGERHHQALAPLDEMQRGAPGRPRPESRQARQQADQRLQVAGRHVRTAG